MKPPFRVHKADAFLRELIDQGRLSGRTRLPSISRLAALSGVSFVTMWKAVQGLKKQGLLTGRPHGMTVIGGSGEPKTPAGTALERELNAPGKRPLDVAARIERDLLNGAYTPGARLGSYKELTNRYGVCFATMKKAVGHLIDRGVLSRVRKSITVPRTSAHRPSTRITLLGIDAPHEIITLGTVGSQLLQSIEMECARAGVGLDITSFHLGDDGIFFTDLASGRPGELLDSESTIGYLYLLVAGISSQETVFRRLQHFRKPVAVMDIAGADVPRFALDDGNVRLFVATAALTPGVQMSRFLAGQGHRKVAYFSPYHESRWSQVRLEGLRRGLTEGTVVPYTLSRITHSDYFSESSRHAEIASLWKSLKKWEQENTGRLGGFLGASLRARAEDACASVEIRSLLSTYFAEALADRSITAWVCANDGVAGMALEFLAEHHAEVPRRVSVVGFDDSPEAMERRLTSYNFNIAALGRAMLDYALRRGGGPWTQRRRKIEIEGVIVERRTTGPARG